jgi:hypothetical protein
VPGPIEIGSGVVILKASSTGVILSRLVASEKKPKTSSGERGRLIVDSKKCGIQY